MTGELRVTPATAQCKLTGFSGPELMILAHHLQYAADRLRQELDILRQAGRKRYFYPKKARNVHKQQPGLMISHWAGLIRDQRYFTSLARAVEVILDDPWNTLFIPDCPRPPLDLSGLLTGDNQYFFRFLNRERHRAQLAGEYIWRETFDEGVKQDLLLALDIEIRFFTCLLAWLEPLIPANLTAAGPDDERISLLFVSLPRVLATGYARIVPHPVDQATRSTKEKGWGG